MADVYEITGQSERYVLGPDGRPGHVRVVTFTTKPHGIAGTVNVNVDGYNAEAVDAAVRGLAAELERVAAL